ncbi:hypothetical protein [Saccharopolyspora dendranthemae]|uniref:Uncharacterized protein n=1 Tax=Saccharopolyspora dendranthemae TaxID=1181886 RepID=A0A561U4V2_9PSEU|nr:hypothetical protein [Saccharopolyspora dendranthemae]TWF94398.1 hypothetical protein FHU35_13102 [Saccharopolyspora dendranthemae]
MTSVDRDRVLEDLRRLSTELTEAFTTAGDVAYSIDVPGGPSVIGREMHEVPRQLYDCLHTVQKAIGVVDEIEVNSGE